MPQQKVLIIRDAYVEIGVVESRLIQKGRDCIAANALDQGLALLTAESPDIVVLDVSRSEQPALDACCSIRAVTTIPIIILSCHWTLESKLRFFNAGADDYIIKPFAIEEVEARIDIHLRRASNSHATSNLIHSGELIIDPIRRVVTRSGACLKLTKMQFEFLRMLASHPDQVVPYARLIDEVWGHSYVEPETVHVLVYHLRRRLGDSNGSSLILAVPGVGYRLRISDDQ